MAPTILTLSNARKMLLMGNLRKSIDDLELSVRTYKCLKSVGVKFAWQLIQWTEKEILTIDNLGRKSLYELKQILKENDLVFGTVLMPELQEELKRPDFTFDLPPKKRLIELREHLDKLIKSCEEIAVGNIKDHDAITSAEELAKS